MDRNIYNHLKGRENMRTTLSAPTSIASPIDADPNLSSKRLNTAPKAEMMWRAIRILNEEGKNFSAPDILKLCDDISIDYVKKFVVSLYFRGIIARISPSIGIKPAVYGLIKDEKPDPLFIPSYVYRQLKGSKGAEIGSKSSEAVKEPLPKPPEKSTTKIDTSTDNSKSDTTTPIADKPATLKPDESATSKPDKPTASKPDTNATKASAIDTKIAHCILRGYQEDLANKVQQLILYTHKIYEDKRSGNLREGYLLLDLIRGCLTLYFLKSAQVAGDSYKGYDSIKGIDDILSTQRKEDKHARCP
jgi:hypothetical protein